jgi:hypothetical protein
LQLNFVGVTVEPERPYIHFPSNRHLFAPTCIGDEHSAIQIYDLYNGGSIPVRYEFDLTALQALQEVGASQIYFNLCYIIFNFFAGEFPLHDLRMFEP